MSVLSQRRMRLVLLALAALAMAAGLVGGLARLGTLPAAPDGLVAHHGPLMVAGFFATVIALERAVAMGRLWAYGAPAANALGALLLVAGQVVPAGIAFLAGAVVLLAASLVIAGAQVAVFTIVLAIGAAALAVGNLLWLLGVPVPELVFWWLAFFALTIAAERLELSRFRAAPAWAETLFVGLVLVVVAGAALAPVHLAGRLLFGLGLLGLALWLWNFDLARSTVRGRGQARFMAVALLAGYVWLALAGLGMLADAGETTVFGYDMTLHMVLIGFALSMVFGHALTILPAVAAVALRYHPALYVPLAILHVSVLARVIGGLADLQPLRAASGALTVFAILLFGALLASATRSARSARRHRPQGSRP